MRKDNIIIVNFRAAAATRPCNEEGVSQEMAWISTRNFDQIIFNSLS
jgi:hypothetical protein